MQTQRVSMFLSFKLTLMWSQTGPPNRMPPGRHMKTVHTLNVQLETWY